MLQYIENRKAPRLDIEMTIAMYDINTIDSVKESEKFPVEVCNISSSGIGFVTSCDIDVHSFYKANLVFSTKESVDVIIEVVRMQEAEDGKTFYGGAFVAMTDVDRFKIDVFRLFEEEKKK